MWFQQLRNQLANYVTLCNLGCGVLGITALWAVDNPDVTLAWENWPVYYFVFAACVFDFADGLVARLLNTQSPMGKQLDSLSDLVSFGVLPGLWAFRHVHSLGTDVVNVGMAALVALLLPVFAAWRLARYNVSEENNDYFQGLPSPAAGLAVSTASACALPSQAFGYLAQMPAMWGIIYLYIGLMMVSEVEMFSLKPKVISQKEILKFTLLIISVLASFFFYGVGGVFTSILAYMILSVIFRPKTTEAT